MSSINDNEQELKRACKYHPKVNYVDEKHSIEHISDYHHGLLEDLVDDTFIED